MQLNTYLSFNGNCRQAFDFYAKVLGGKVTAMMTFAGTPACDHVAAHEQDYIMHGCLDVGAYRLMGTDATGDHPYAGVTGAHVVIDVSTAEEAERVFSELAEGGNVIMPLEKTFWAERYGMLSDRYGTPWMINCSPIAGCTVD